MKTIAMTVSEEMTDKDDRTMDVKNNQQGGETTSPGGSKMSITNPLFW